MPKQKNNALNINDIYKYLDSKKFFKNYVLRKLTSGFANKNFLILAGRKKYNLRATRKRPPLNKEALRNEYIILKFLEKKNINFVSRSFHYDGEENIHIVKYLTGRKICIKDLSERNLKTILAYLHKINSLADNFQAFYKKKNINFKKPVKSKTLLKSINQNIELLKNKKNYQFTINWARKKIKKDWLKLRVPEKNIYLNHGDPVSNIIINKNKLYLIDWEQTKFSYNPGLAYIFLHGDLNNARRNKIIEIYSKLSSENENALKIAVYKKLKQLLIENIIDLCKVHSRNKELFNSKKGLNSQLIKGRMAYYDYVALSK